jgi:hypothetical protein
MSAMQPQSSPSSPGNADEDIRVDNPAADVQLPATAQVKTAVVTHGGGEYRASYGPDPVHNGGPVSAVAADGGSTWNLSRGAGGPTSRFGFSYLTGYWQLFHTERTRTITWGGITNGAGRMLPEGNGMPERDQIFVFDGEANVEPSGSTGERTKVSKGHYITATTVGGKVTLSEPKPIPTKDMPNPPPDAEDILAFLGALKSAHPTDPLP